MASMSPPTEGVGQARRRRGRSALPAALTLRVEVVEQLVCHKLDLLVPRLRGSVRAGDQPHPVDPTEVAVDEGVARLRAVLRAHGRCWWLIRLWCGVGEAGQVGCGLAVRGCRSGRGHGGDWRRRCWRGRPGAGG